MISWIVIVILVIVGIFAIKMNHLRHRIFIILLILLALFLYTSIAVITNQNNLEINNVEGVFQLTKVYTGWLANGFENLKTMTGNIIKMDWTSTNASFFDKTDKQDLKKK